jgi:hypothetical protein
MRTDLRVKHDIDARKKAAELFGKGRGFERAWPRSSPSHAAP